MSQMYQNVLKDNGKILLVGGESKGQYPQDLIISDQVLLWTDDNLKKGAVPVIPGAVRVIGISKACSHASAKGILKQARERQIKIIPGFPKTNELIRTAREIIRSNPVELKIASPLDEQEFDKMQEEIVHAENNGVPVVAERKIAARGSVKQFIIQHADLKRGTSEEAKRLFDLAPSYGIKTTLGSLEQAIRNRKRDIGVGDIPRSIARVRSIEPEWKTLLRDVQNSIAALQLFEEQVKKMAEEIEELRKFKADFHQKMKSLFGE